ncbi:MAG: hypothetical protein PHN75_05820 [Syntrophales bacterium]|nr:hypothetical protein [Syntrophales bacterium]
MLKLGEAANHILSRFVVTIMALSIFGVSSVTRLDAEMQNNSEKLSETNGMAYMEERILFSSGHTISSMKPDCSDKRLIDKGPASFRISPDGRWMLVLPFDVRNGRREEVQEVRLYDLRQASFRRLIFPDGNWVRLACWWSDDSRKLNMYSATTDKEKPFDYPLNLNAAAEAKIDRILTYHLDSGTFSIQTYRDNNPIVFDFLAARGPSARSRCEFLAPDEKYKLKWDVPDNMETYGEPCGEEYIRYKHFYSIKAMIYYDIVLVSNNNSAGRLVFKNNKGDDFGSFVYPITEFPWAPDSKHFVLEKFIGGFWRSFLLDVLSIENKKRGIYVIDRETLKWRFVTYGNSPYWFAKLPLEFIEQPRLNPTIKVVK